MTMFMSDWTPSWSSLVARSMSSAIEMLARRLLYIVRWIGDGST
jgi:hypothetical protein